MFFYLFIFVVLSIFSFSEALGFTGKSAKYLFACICLFLFALVAGLRYETGVDWYVYRDMFRNIDPVRNLTEKSGRENILGNIDLGYSLFTSFIKELGGSIQTVFFLLASWTGFYIYYGIKRYSPFPATSLLIYYCLVFFYLDMSGIRQAFALSVFLYSSKYILRRQAMKFVSYMVLAILFHWSAILLIPMYFLTKKISSKVLLVILSLSVVVYFLNIQWFTPVLTKLFPVFDNQNLMEKALVYTHSEKFAKTRVLNLTTIVNSIFIISIFIFLIVRRRKLEHCNHFNFFLNIYLLQILAYFSISELVEVSNRMRLYFVVANVILLPLLLQTLKDIYIRTSAVILVIFYCGVCANSYLLERPMTVAYHPYQNYLMYKWFEKESTGQERLKEHIRLHQ